MKRLLVLALAVLAALAYNPAPASAFTNSVVITNESDKCAWFTMYFSVFPTGWEIFHHLPEGVPQYIAPGKSHKFSMGAEGEMKIRAQVTLSGKCDGATGPDTYDIRKDGSTRYINYTAHLVNHNGGYQLWFN